MYPPAGACGLVERRVHVELDPERTTYCYVRDMALQYGGMPPAYEDWTPYPSEDTSSKTCPRARLWRWLRRLCRQAARHALVSHLCDKDDLADSILELVALSDTR